MLDAHLAFLDQQIANVQQRIRQHIEHCPELCQQQCLLMSIPGIGQLTAAKLLAEIRDIRAFETAR
jgi:transposase